MPYKSRGTVRVESIAENGKGVIFVPDNDHSVKSENNGYAVFFRDSGENPFDRGRIVDLKENRRGIPVALGENFKNNNWLATNLLSSVATKKCKVEIKVKITDGSNGGVTLDDIAQIA